MNRLTLETENYIFMLLLESNPQKIEPNKFSLKHYEKIMLGTSDQELLKCSWTVKSEQKLQSCLLNYYENLEILFVTCWKY